MVYTLTCNNVRLELFTSFVVRRTVSVQVRAWLSGLNMHGSDFFIFNRLCSNVLITGKNHCPH